MANFLKKKPGLEYGRDTFPTVHDVHIKCVLGSSHTSFIPSMKREAEKRHIKLSTQAGSTGGLISC